MKHIGCSVSKRVVRTLCTMVQCSLVDRSLSPSHWGELMLTRAYLCNQLPHSAPQMETPQTASYVKDADPSQLKMTGTRAFGARPRRIVEARYVVFIETHLHLIPQLSQPSPLQQHQPPSLDFTDGALDHSKVSSNEPRCV